VRAGEGDSVRVSSRPLTRLNLAALDFATKPLTTFEAPKWVTMLFASAKYNYKVRFDLHGVSGCRLRRFYFRSLPGLITCGRHQEETDPPEETNYVT